MFKRKSSAEGSSENVQQFHLKYRFSNIQNEQLESNISYNTFCKFHKSDSKQ